MLRRQGNQLLDQFVVLALQVHLVDDIADAAHGPKLFDECIRVVLALLRQLRRKIEFSLFLADLAANGYLGVAWLLVAPDQHQLFALEQVVDVARIHAIDRRAIFHANLLQIEFNSHVRHHGRTDTVVQAADVRLDVFVRTHELALAVVGAGQPIQQSAVHVVAHAKVDDARSMFVVFTRAIHNLGFVRFAGRWQAVGQEDHVAGPFGILDHAQGRC